LNHRTYFLHLFLQVDSATGDSSKAAISIHIDSQNYIATGKVTTEGFDRNTAEE